MAYEKKTFNTHMFQDSLELMKPIDGLKGDMDESEQGNEAPKKKRSFFRR